MQNCLNCKYQPKWEDCITAGQKSGICGYPINKIKLPAVVYISVSGVHMFSDGSGLPENCQAWAQGANKADGEVKKAFKRLENLKNQGCY